MFKYLKQYTWPDMKQVIENSKLPPTECSDRLDGKLCVITGATSGVGLEAVRRLHAYGADILMINRNRVKSEALVLELLNDSGSGSGSGSAAASGLQGSRSRKIGLVNFLLADFRDLQQVKEVVNTLMGLERPIDVLINNAGIHMTRRIETPQGCEEVFGVNHLSSFLITKVLAARMAQQESGRIIQVNSQGHRFFGLNLKDVHWKKRPYIGLRAYGAAKTAQLLCCWEFADQLKESPITINAMHPGAVKTNVGTNNGPLYRWYHRNFVWKNLDDPTIAGIALHYLAASPEMEKVSGEYFNLTHREKPAPHALDRELGRQVWDVSCELVRPFEDFV